MFTGSVTLITGSACLQEMSVTLITERVCVKEPVSPRILWCVCFVLKKLIMFKTTSQLADMISES